MLGEFLICQNKAHSSTLPLLVLCFSILFFLIFFPLDFPGLAMQLRVARGPSCLHFKSAGLMELQVCASTPGRPADILRYPTASHLSAPLVCCWLETGQLKQEAVQACARGVMVSCGNQTITNHSLLTNRWGSGVRDWILNITSMLLLSFLNLLQTETSSLSPI